MDESHSRGRPARTPDFSLTNEDLREVAAFAASAAAEVLPIFQAQLPGDDRPRQAAHAARAEELEYADVQDAAWQALERAVKRATRALRSVLSRYAATSPGTTRVAELVHFLDTALRAQRRPEPDWR